MTDTQELNIEDAEKQVQQAQAKLERAKRIKVENKNDEFRRKVKKNEARFNKITAALENLDQIEDVNKLGCAIMRLDDVSMYCQLYDYDDYDDTPYGRQPIGPIDAHEINTKVKRANREFLEEVKERLYKLLTEYSWTKGPYVGDDYEF
jgi:hypothetical protein